VCLLYLRLEWEWVVSSAATAAAAMPYNNSNISILNINRLRKMYKCTHKAMQPLKHNNSSSATSNPNPSHCRSNAVADHLERQQQQQLAAALLD
jgi:hypothetical protein